MACQAGIDTIIAAGSKPGAVGDVMNVTVLVQLFHAQATCLKTETLDFGAPPAG